jgi:hypothetical protein
MGLQLKVRRKYDKFQLLAMVVLAQKMVAPEMSFQMGIIFEILEAHSLPKREKK